MAWSIRADGGPGGVASELVSLLRKEGVLKGEAFTMPSNWLALGVQTLLVCKASDIKTSELTQDFVLTQAFAYYIPTMSFYIFLCPLYLL